MKNKNKNNPADFYNGIAGEYDEMFDFQGDLEAARGVVAGLKAAEQEVLLLLWLNRELKPSAWICPNQWWKRLDKTA
jgi:hypothetical protein